MLELEATPELMSTYAGLGIVASLCGHLRPVRLAGEGRELHLLHLRSRSAMLKATFEH